MAVARALRQARDLHTQLECDGQRTVLGEGRPVAVALVVTWGVFLAVALDAVLRLWRLSTSASLLRTDALAMSASLNARTDIAESTIGMNPCSRVDAQQRPQLGTWVPSTPARRPQLPLPHSLASSSTFPDERSSASSSRRPAPRRTAVSREIGRRRKRSGFPRDDPSGGEFFTDDVATVDEPSPDPLTGQASTESRPESSGQLPRLPPGLPGLGRLTVEEARCSIALDRARLREENRTLQLQLRWQRLKEQNSASASAHPTLSPRGARRHALPPPSCGEARRRPTSAGFSTLTRSVKQPKRGAACQAGCAGRVVQDPPAPVIRASLSAPLVAYLRSSPGLTAAAQRWGFLGCALSPCCGNSPELGGRGGDSIDSSVRAASLRRSAEALKRNPISSLRAGHAGCPRVGGA